MLDYLIEHQANIMSTLSCMCGVIAVFVLFMKSLPKNRRSALLAVEVCAMVLLMADYFAYTYRGDPSGYAYWIVRISNFLVFFLNILRIILILMNIFRSTKHFHTNSSFFPQTTQ